MKTTDTTETTVTGSPEGELWKNYTGTQRARLEEIRVWQQRVGLSDADFVAGCPGMAAQTWYMLSTGRYPAKDCTRICGIAFKHAPVRRKAHERASKMALMPLPYIETAKWQEVEAAVESANAAAEIGDDDKVVWVVGASGMGKTEIARQLVSRMGARIVTASESWREGYLDALTDFAAALGVPGLKNMAGQDKAWPSKGTAERAIKKHLKERPCIICVNEVEFFSRRVLNLLRSIADETRAVVVIFCVPDFHKDIVENGGAYAKQLRTRTEGVVWLDKVEAEDAAAVLTHYWPKMEDVKQAAKALSSYANSFGGWRVLKRITRNLRSLMSDSPPALEQVQAAIEQQRDYQGC